MNRRDEHVLVRKAAGGDRRAIEALIRAHQDSLYAFILRMSGRPETAEDIVQEAIVRVLRNLHRFDDRFRFSTWLFTIGKRLYMNAVQKLGPAYDSAAVDGFQSFEAGPGHVSARAEAIDNARSLIAGALAALPALQREIILLFHQQCWPISEIAVHLAMPEGTIKSHLHRGRRRMRRHIVADGAAARRAGEACT